jgi:hypothetical protein
MLLLNYGQDCIWIGQVIRWPSNDPTQEIRECMLFDPKDGSGSLGLVEIAGYGSGHVLFYFPHEVYFPGTRALSTRWLIENFSKFIEENVDVSQVHIGKDRDFTDIDNPMFK